jgi:uncharacterized protein YecE (DUF72 family)
MAILKLGCAGWDYKDWIGSFYPKNLDRSFHLNFYSNYFDIIEVNSSFYNLPSEKYVKNWYQQVPNNFQFIIKVWQEITHKLGEDDVEELITKFFNTMTPLQEKLYGYLFQYPPWFKYSIEHENKIKNLLNKIPNLGHITIIFEFRDDSWFNSKENLKFLTNSGVTIATTYKPEITPYYYINQRNYYIRLIGDRELTNFNAIQRSQEESINNLIKNVENLRRNPKIFQIFIIVNNHFAGFAPESVNLLKKMLNLPIRDFSFQKKLSDYF